MKEKIKKLINCITVIIVLFFKQIFNILNFFKKNKKNAKCNINTSIITDTIIGEKLAIDTIIGENLAIDRLQIGKSNIIESQDGALTTKNKNYIINLTPPKYFDKCYNINQMYSQQHK